MKLDEQRVDDLIRRAATFRVILLHGDDPALVADRARQAVRAIMAAGSGMFPPVELSGAEHPRAGAELNAPMLDGGHRLVRLRDATDSAAVSVEAVLDRATGGTLLIEAGVLTPKSRLRSVVERSPTGVAMACRGPDSRALASAVDRVIAEAGLQLDHDARDMLMGLSPGGVLAGPRDVLGDAEKLVLLVAGTGRSVEGADVLAVQADCGRGALDDLSFAVGAGRLVDVDRQMEDLLSDGVPPATLIRSVVAHMARLRVARRAIDRGMNTQAAVAALRPPVFFKRAEEFRAAVTMWSAEDLDRACAVLWRADRACRETANPASSICRRVLSNLRPADAASA